MRYLEIYTSGAKLEIKSIGDIWAIIKGYAVIFGGKDKDGDTFIKHADYDLARLKGTPIYIEHTLTGVSNKVGEIADYLIDDIGILVEVKLNKTLAPVREFLEKIKKGIVGFSTGSAGHLVRRMKNVVTKWPIVELSLTENPAEPRTIQYGLQQIKSAELKSSLEAEQENGIEVKNNDADVVRVETKIQINL